MALTPPANPSNPSVKFAPFDTAVMMNVTMMMLNDPRICFCAGTNPTDQFAIIELVIFYNGIVVIGVFYSRKLSFKHHQFFLTIIFVSLTCSFTSAYCRYCAVVKTSLSITNRIMK